MFATSALSPGPSRCALTLHIVPIIRPATRRPRQGVSRPEVARATVLGGGTNGGDGGGTGGGGGGDGDGWSDDGGERPGGGRGKVALALALASAHLALTASDASALCGIGGKAEEPKPSETDSLVDNCVDVAGPIAANLGFSGALGLASATALKCLSATIGVAIGVAFIFVQVLSHYGVITVHWSNINEKVVALADSNGDGRLDASDYRAWGKKLLGVLSEGVPSIGGFAAGFAMGLRF